MLIEKLLALASTRTTKQKVFGIGWAKTGTTTLGQCLRTLGYKHLSQRLDLFEDLAGGNLANLLKIAKKYQSFDDWPWILLYREMDHAFPNSKFILTTRAPDTWLRSYKNMLGKERKPSQELILARQFIYQADPTTATDQILLKKYQEHHEQVIDYFKDRPDDLLVVNWEEGDGWGPLCRFLGKGIPAAPFPHANKGKYTKTI
jgi:hypothetical protein